MKAFADLADLPEDDRIAIIGRTTEESIKPVGFFVDDDAKADRYIEKLTKRFKVELVERYHDVLVKGSVFIKLRRRPDA